MRHVALLVFLCIAGLAMAQTSQAPPANPSQYPPTGIISTEKPKSGVESKPRSMLQAPEPGHPLDPNDVMVLTGKDKQRSPYALPMTYYGGAQGYYVGPNSQSSLPMLSGDLGGTYVAPGYSYGYGYSNSPLPLLGGNAAPLDATPILKFPVFVRRHVFTPLPFGAFSPFTPFGVVGPPVLFGPGARSFGPFFASGGRF